MLVTSIQQIDLVGTRLHFVTSYLQDDCNSLYSTVQFSSVNQLCPTICDPIDHSTPGLPVLQELLKLTQTHLH